MTPRIESAVIANPEAIPSARKRIHAMVCVCAGDLDNCPAHERAAALAATK